MPTHAVFLCLIYPVVGLLLGWFISGMGWLPLLYPLVTGFALLGPFAAIGLYEISRQREQGHAVDLRDAFDVYLSPSFGAIAALGLLLLIIFLVWLASRSRSTSHISATDRNRRSASSPAASSPPPRGGRCSSSATASASCSRCWC